MPSSSGPEARARHEAPEPQPSGADVIPSSNRPGQRPFKALMRVRTPQGLHIGTGSQAQAPFPIPYTQMMQRKTSLSQEQGLAGSNPALRTIYTPLAQCAEHLTLNQRVMGSSPIRRTLGVAQLAERRVVAPVVGGSSPLPHPVEP